jgi:hypothetical protein
MQQREQIPPPARILLPSAVQKSWFLCAKISIQQKAKEVLTILTIFFGHPSCCFLAFGEGLSLHSIENNDHPF